MRILKWYSAVVIMFSLVTLLVSLLAGTSTDTTTDTLAILLYAPVGTYLIMDIVQKRKK